MNWFNSSMHSLLAVGLLILLTNLAAAQPSVGTTGLLNTPSAEMREDGTFIVGGNYLPTSITPQYFNYNTGNYFFNITFLPFLEVTYKLTLLKVINDNFNQDRSVMLRSRLLNEKNYTPSFVLGVNDIYSSSGSENRFFNTAYWVASKTFNHGLFTVATTLGQYFSMSAYQIQEGYFSGVSISPTTLDGLQLIAEYDSKALNAGISLLLLRHVTIYAFAYNMKYFSGGIHYRISLGGY